MGKRTGVLWICGCVLFLLLVIAIFVFVPDGALGRTTGAATFVAGIASGVGAAVAAWLARQSARESKDASRQIQQIGEDARKALGRAMKPSVTCRFSPADNVLTVENSGMWIARDVDVLVDISGSTAFQTRLPYDLTPLGDTRHSWVRDIPPFTEDLWRVGTPLDFGRPNLVLIASLITLWFSDGERITRYESKFRADFQIDSRTRKVEVFLDPQLISQIEVDPVTLAPMEGTSS